MSEQRVPLLSIGMIVKNEMRCLERCLNSLKPLRQAVSSELVIADTGSDDGTRELASQYADILFDFPWRNDFSAARNAVMDRCSGTWFLSIDADEFFDDDLSELAAYLKNPRNQGTNVCTLTIRNYNTPDMLGQYTDFAAVRLLRMSTGLRYQGAIHEHWEFPAGTRWHPFTRTILHHDGYAFATQEDSLKKAIRNLELLEPRLAAAKPVPGNLLLECLDSSISIPEKAERYARACAAWLEENSQNPYWPELGPAMMRKMIDAADRYQMEELTEWIEQAKRRFPLSPFTQIDIAYQSILYSFQSGQYETVLELVGGYYQAVNDYHQGKYSVSNFGVSGLYRAGLQSIQEVQIMEAVSQTQLGLTAAALNTLRSVPMPESTPPKLAMMWLDAVAPFAEEAQTPQMVAQKMEDILCVHNDTPRERARRQACLKRIAASFLPGQMREEWKLYQELPFDLGKSAKLMALSRPSELEALLAEIQNWGEVPPPAIDHVIACQACLPASFYLTQTHAELNALAHALPNYDTDFVPHIMAWPKAPSGGLRALEFRLETVYFALCNPAFVKNERYSALCAHLCGIAEEFLGRLYHPALCGEDLLVLPDLHRCVWHLLQTHTAACQSQWHRAITALQDALTAMPSSRPIIEHRMREIQRQLFPVAASEELRSLAQQIQTLLSQYAPDDPAIQTIKRSEAYQKVAYLIEGAEAAGFGNLLQ